MSNIRFPENFIEWASKGGWTVSYPEGEGRVIVRTDPEGEIQFFIQAEGDWIKITRSERGSKEKRFIDVASGDALTALFFGYCGGSVRESLGLRLLDVPFEATNVAQGFSIVSPDAEGGATLVNFQGAAVAKSDNGSMNVGNLVELSYYLSGSLDDLRTSFLSSDGKPLFSVL